MRSSRAYRKEGAPRPSRACGEVVEQLDGEEGERLPGRVDQEPTDLPGDALPEGIHRRSLQHGPLDPSGVAHRQVGDDLAPEGVAD